jgi:phosphoribosylanthranilate isomerase
MWIKICGMTSAQAVDAALAAGVDALGFVFASSARQLTPADAAVLAAPARGRVPCVAVTLHPTQAQVEEILAVFQPDMLQSEAADLAILRLPASLAQLHVVRTGALPAPPARLLFEGPQSGSGARSDWEAARALARRAQLVLAGGLNAANVAHAIAAVRPFGVDVSSGVELRPGVKDPEKIAVFVRTVRAVVRTPATGSEEGT